MGLTRRNRKYKNPGIKPGNLYWCRVEDSNLRTRKRTDLQSVVFDRFTNPAEAVHKHCDTFINYTSHVLIKFRYSRTVSNWSRQRDDSFTP